MSIRMAPALFHSTWIQETCGNRDRLTAQSCTALRELSREQLSTIGTSLTTSIFHVQAIGDLFFDLFEVLISPLSCAQGRSHRPGHGCTNPEAVATDLVVNKLTLEVDDRYSGYASARPMHSNAPALHSCAQGGNDAHLSLCTECNIGINGTDQRGHACKSGSYCCFCEDSSGHKEQPCNQTLGREDLTGHFSHHLKCLWFLPSYTCYEEAVFHKISTSQHSAFWYSSLASGYCDAPGSSGPCTWRVVAVDKIVSRKCHTEVFGAVVQATQPSSCLDACGTQKTNTSSPCWVRPTASHTSVLPAHARALLVPMHALHACPCPYTVLTHAHDMLRISTCRLIASTRRPWAPIVESPGERSPACRLLS